MAQRNNFIDNVDLSETNVIKHSPYYSETQFIDLLSQKAGLCILDLNVQNIAGLNLQNY